VNTAFSNYLILFLLIKTDRHFFIIYLNEMSIIACEKIPIFDKINSLNIYIGDIVAVTSLKILNNVDIVISLVEIPTNETKVNYFIFPLEDRRDVNISSLFERTNEIIENNKDKKILINCYNGVSRSVTILLAYFISIGITLKDGLDKLKNRKQYSKPNIGFMRQLLKYEKEIIGKNSLNLNEFISITSVRSK